MNLIKWIVCEVAPEKRDIFDRILGNWGLVSMAEGFVAQLGGFAQGHQAPLRGCILGLWRDVASYQAFMGGLHDRLAAPHSEQKSYDAITVRLGHPSQEAHGVGNFMDAAQRSGTGELLRVARCQLKSGCQESFLRKQREIWNPGMAETRACLAALTMRDNTDPSTWFVLSLWRSEQAHEAYRRDQLPVLQERAQPMNEIAEIEGWIVPLEPTWLVAAEQ